ncbi:hypothetical protein D3C71_1760290 [compost metagenome]
MRLAVRISDLQPQETAGCTLEIKINDIQQLAEIGDLVLRPLACRYIQLAGVEGNGIFGAFELLRIASEHMKPVR